MLPRKSSIVQIMFYFSPCNQRIYSEQSENFNRFRLVLGNIFLVFWTPFDTYESLNRLPY